MFEPAVFSRRLLTCLAVCLASLPVSRAFAETWREVDSPHFRVITDGSERNARNVAKEFEQMRSVFAVRFNDPKLETGAPLLIVAVSEPGLHALGPDFWSMRDKVAGEFFKGWEHQYAMVRLDAFGDQNQAVIFHEYAHSVLHANLHWLPTWLDEGMAEFYGYTRIQADRTYIGAPTIRYEHLNRQALLPVSQMLTMTNRDIGKDIERNDLFYAEAWAMVHYMTFGEGMGDGHQLNRFIALMESGKSQAEAFQTVFGDVNAFEKKLYLHLSKLALSAAVLPPMPAPDTKTFPAKVLTRAEADYELGAFDLVTGEAKLGISRLKEAETTNPALAGPHEELGFFAWRQGRDTDAISEWQQAVKADPASYRSAFALLMSSTQLQDENTEQLEQTLHALDAIRAEAPKYAPALVETALVQWRLGQMNPAYKSALAAERLEPWRAGYRILLGYILLQGNQPKMAADYARTAADRWFGSDHDEAVDLWSQIPPAARGDAPSPTLAISKDLTVARGTILSTSCSESGLSVTLQPNTPGASVLKLAATAPFESGFSDTLWVGEDHYTDCFHLAGLPAVVAYKPDAAGPAKMFVFEVRDNLPALHLDTGNAKSAPPSTAAPSTR